MTYYLKLYVATLIVFFVLDLIWLGVVARGFYQQQIGFLMAPAVNWAAAITFYLLFIVGILVFAVLPGVQENSLQATLFRAALFGLIAYATCDLTNLATLKDWPLTLTIVDLMWGTVLSMSVSFAGFTISKWIV